MARTAITVGNLSRNAGTDVTKTVTAGSTGANGWNIASFDRDEIVIMVENTGSVTGAIIVEAPTTDGLYSTAKDVGNLEVVVGGSIEMAIIVDGARFKKTDGSIDIAAAASSGASFTGAIRAIDPTGM